MRRAACRTLVVVSPQAGPIKRLPRSSMFSTAKNATDSLNASRSRSLQRTMRLIRNRGKDGWLLGFGKLDFGRKATKLRIRRGSSAVSFQLSYSSSLVAPDLNLSTFWLRQMPTALMSIGLKPSCREPTGTPAVLKSLTQAGDVILIGDLVAKATTELYTAVFRCLTRAAAASAVEAPALRGIR
jgi:hypothetical protein